MGYDINNFPMLLPLLVICFPVFVLSLLNLFSNKQVVQFEKIKKMLNNDIDEMKEKLIRLNALKNVDNNECEIEYLEDRIKHFKYLLDYLNYKR